MPFTLPCLGRGPGCATVPANHWYNWCNCLLGRHDNHHTNLHLPQVTLNPFTPPFMKFLSHLSLPHLSHEKEIDHYSSVWLHYCVLKCCVTERTILTHFMVTYQHQHMTPPLMIVQRFKQYSNSIQMHSEIPSQIKPQTGIYGHKPSGLSLHSDWSFLLLNTHDSFTVNKVCY